MARKPASSKKKKTAAAKKTPAKKAASDSGRTAKEAALEKLNQKQFGNAKFQSVILFSCAILFFLIAFIHGSAGWYFLHRFVRGIFGFSVILVPIFLVVSAYYAEHRSGMSLPRRLIFSFGITILTSSFVQILFVGGIEKKTFFRAVGYLYQTAADNAFTSGGVISVILTYPLIRILGTVGARIVIVVLLFIAIMWMLDWSMGQLWYYIMLPFRKLRINHQFRTVQIHYFYYFHRNFLPDTHACHLIMSITFIPNWYQYTPNMASCLPHLHALYTNLQPPVTRHPLTSSPDISSSAGSHQDSIHNYKS